MSRVTRRSLRALHVIAASAATCFGALCFVPPCHAGPAPSDPAKEAYNRGTAAYRSGDYALSAAEYARADELSPNDVALQAALESAVLADDVLLGMMLLERSRRGPAEGGLKAAVDAAREKFAGRAGRIRAACGNPPSCKIAVDGVPVDVRTSPWFRTGTHKILIESSGRQEVRSVEVPADGIVDIAPSLPPAASAESAAPRAAPAAPATTPNAAAAPANAASTGLSPTWFFVGAGVSLALAGVATWSGLDTSSQHDDFVAAGCDKGPAQGCNAMSADGKNAQLRTNILIGAAASTGIASATMGLLFVKWGHENTASPSVSWSPGLTSASVRVAF